MGGAKKKKVNIHGCIFLHNLIIHQIPTDVKLENGSLTIKNLPLNNWPITIKNEDVECVWVMSVYIRPIKRWALQS